ncbi:MAG: hypothetical protein K1Y02_00345 [Candidatus Hydrogenedentes bacterium]|nr:hypothetical protein [Candidatus Hydrogenedentota bacterium]
MAAAGTTEAPAPGRKLAVDVLRGFVMFWIIGNDSYSEAFKAISPTGIAGFLSRQLTHPKWEGFVFYDVIFPTFLFVIGISITLSLDKIIANEGLTGAYKRIFRRFLLMFFLAFIYDEGFAKIHEEDVLCGVMQRLALCYLFGSLIYCHVKSPRGLLITFVILVGSYWALMSFVPIPGRDTVSFLRRENWNDYINMTFNPYHDSDPEGFLSTIPAVGSCIIGLLVGLFLKNKTVPEQKKVWYLLGAGVVMIVLGYLWSFQFPIIKRVWSPSYVFVAGGCSLLLLAFFQQLLDIWKVRTTLFTPFLWLGSNALAVYMAVNLVSFESIAERLVGGPIADAAGRFGPMLITVVSVALSLWLTKFLYDRKIFIRV